MKFCEKCGNILHVESGKTATYLMCRKCGRKYRLKGEKVTISTSMHETKKEIVVMGKDEGIEELPKQESSVRNANTEKHSGGCSKQEQLMSHQHCSTNVPNVDMDGEVTDKNKYFCVELITDGR